MLESLTIHQVALIDQATIRFHKGMQVLTGETGAGKSIVVDSVNLILGGRADRDLIRTGCEKASVEAVFSTGGNEQILRFMEQEGIDYDGNNLTVYREISSGGKNICRICGVLMPVSRLRDISPFLLDIHGQSEHRFLTDPEMHLAFLDQTGDKEHRMLLAKVKKDHDLFIENHRAYARLVRQNENRDSRMASLERDLEELKKSKIEAGEASRLLARRKTLAENEKIAALLKSVRDMISGDDESISCLSRIKEASDTLKTICLQDSGFADLSTRCEALYFELEEIAYQINTIAERSDFDPAELEKNDKRLDLIHRLERKHGTDADMLPALLVSMEEEYKLLSELGNEISRMSAEHKNLLAVYRKSARELTESRKKLAAVFEKRMIEELGQLGMGETRFQVAFIPNETGRPLMPTDHGDDRVEFMISPNPGEPLKPLAKTASGGELSRLMLAIKTLESAHTGVDAMVFDEIDTGISGRMAQVVAEKMITISRDRQVICVTHLPQIAAAADFQYLVRKCVNNARTSTTVTELDQCGRIAEVSRMISGADGITEESETYASGMLRAASEMKKKTNGIPDMVDKC